jgi:hypothetical protein
MFSSVSVQRLFRFCSTPTRALKAAARVDRAGDKAGYAPSYYILSNALISHAYLQTATARGDTEAAARHSVNVGECLRELGVL